MWKKNEVPIAAPKERPGFSVNKRLCIDRDGLGNVTLYLTSHWHNTVMQITVTADEWCSLVTSVAGDPNTATTHMMVKALHGVK